MDRVPFATLAGDVNRVVLANGFRVLLKEVYPTRVVSIFLWVGTGSADDRRPGVAHFLEHVLFKSSEGLPEGGLARSFHELGGYLNGFTGQEATCYWAALPSRYLDDALRLLAGAVRRPRFDAEECQRETQVILQELRMVQDRPEAYCFERLLGLAYPAHPYGNSILGNEDSLKALTTEDLRQHYDRFYRAENMALVVVGDFEAAPVLERVTEIFRDWPRGMPPPRARAAPPARASCRLDLTGPISSGYLQVAFPIPEHGHEDVYACDLLASILGHGRSCRLARELRERRGLVTHVGAAAIIEKDPGLLVVESVLSPERLSQTEQALFEELASVAREGVSPRELDKARNQVESHFVLAQETVEGQARKLGYYEMMGDYRLAETYVTRLSRVSGEALQRVAERYLVPETACVVTYRPEAGS